jgi:hypothetical protein
MWSQRLPAFTGSRRPMRNEIDHYLIEHPLMHWFSM